MLAAALVITSCTSETNPATNVTPDSATLNASVTIGSQDKGGDFWFEWSRDDGATWTEGPHHPWGDQNCTYSGSGTEGNPIPITENISGLVPGSHYIFRMAGRICNVGVVYGDSNWRRNGDQDPPYEYDSFDTPAVGPQLAASGPLVDAPVSQLISPDSQLTVSVESEGLARIDLLLDGTLDRSIPISDILVDGGTEECSGGSCTLDYTFPAGVANGGPPGVHDFSVVAVDQSNRTDSVSNQVNLDTVGPTVTLSGTLAEADGRLLPTQTADLDVSAVDGEGTTDSGVASIVITVNGQPVVTQEFDCQSGCPEPAAADFIYDKAQWGSGGHNLTVTATDATGNESVEELLVDAAPIEDVRPTCPGIESSSTSPVDVVTPAQATQSLDNSVPGALAPSQQAPAEDPDDLFDPSLQEFPSGGLEATGTALGAQFEGDAAGALSIGQASCVEPTVTTSAESGAELVAGGDAVIHANTAPQTDTLIRPNAIGTTIVQSVRGPAAPTTFSWRLSFRTGEELQPVPGGGVALIAPGGIEVLPTGAPARPANADAPGAIADVATQTDTAIHDLRVANNQLNGEVRAVIPPPVAVAQDGSLVPATLSIGGGGNVLSVTRPAGSVAVILKTFSSPDPVAMCAEAFSSKPGLYVDGCLPQPSPSEPGQPSSVLSIDWAPNGTIFFARKNDSLPFQDASAISGIYALDSLSSRSEPIFANDAYQAMNPQVSADGSSIVFDRCEADWTDCGIYTMNPDGTNVQLVTPTYAQIQSQPRDDQRIELPRPAFSPNGQRIYFFLSDSAPPIYTQLYSIERDGTDRRQITALADGIASLSGAPAVSPDGSTISFMDLNLSSPSGMDLYSVNSNASNATFDELTQLTSGDEHWLHHTPSYSPDGSKLLHAAATLNMPYGAALLTIDVNGTNQTKLYDIPWDASESALSADINPQYSPDGSRIAYLSPVDNGSRRDLGLFRVQSDGTGATYLTNGDNIVTDWATDEESLEGAGADLQEAEAAAVAELAVLDSRIFIPEPITPPTTALPGFYYALNAKERDWCLRLDRLGTCARFWDDREMALDLMDHLFNVSRGPESDGTVSNAFLHSAWTGFMVKSKGPDIDARTFGRLHENDEFKLSNPAPVLRRLSRMDMTNNRVGFKWARNHPGGDLEVCQAMRVDSEGSIFIGARVDPYKWRIEHDFEYFRLIHRKLRAFYDDGDSRVVRLNGNGCLAKF